MTKIIAFDCDSTLSSIEGVDELARLAGPEIFQQVEESTNQAMNGEIAVEEVFGRRLELIRPTREQCLQIGRLYLETIEPAARETIATLQRDGWTCLIISGGFAPCIEPLAHDLGISRIEAVPLHFDQDGSYTGFDESYPTTRSGGKPEIIEALKKEFSPETIVMVGDGVSDLETAPLVDQFIGYLGFVSRPKVAQNSPLTATSLSEIPALLEKG
ncbi:MAG: HAD-IB family phosphatase [Akkermansiaceae bacterium]|jgi:phosphoserine phosphatase